MIAGIIGVWHVVVNAFHVEAYLFPDPSSVLRALVNGIHSTVLLEATWVTFKEVVFGFAIGVSTGIFLAAAITRWLVLERLLFPLIVAVQTVPKIALAPLLFTWFGFGQASKVATAAIIAFFPVLVNTISGLKAIDPDHIALMRSLEASPWQTFRMVRFPSALPLIFVGLDMAAVFSVIGAVVGEFVGAQGGLGYIIQASTQTLDTAAMIAALIFLSLLGITLHSTVKLCERLVVRWQQDSDRVIQGV